MGMALGMALAVLACGCKKQEAPAPTFKMPAVATATAPEDAHYEEQKRIIAELTPFPPLGDGQLTKLPNGDVWVKYGCGIMVQDLRPKDEIPPQFGQFVRITYTEYLTDGAAREGRMVRQAKTDAPWDFRLGSKDVLKGLSMGLSTMKPQTRRRIFIPPELAYGEKGDPQSGVGPDEALIFDVELLSVWGEAMPNVPPPPDFIGPPAPRKPAAP